MPCLKYYTKNTKIKWKIKENKSPPEHEFDTSVK